VCCRRPRTATSMWPAEILSVIQYNFGWLRARFALIPEGVLVPDTLQCPSCGTAIAKNGGCSDMVCEECGHSFTWIARRTKEPKRLSLWDQKSETSLMFGAQ
jgi:predicted RNA-binding Zn-ribbon protein involved in translation (DUF1610 family)